MQDLLTELTVNTNKFYNGSMEYFEDAEQEEKEEQLKVYRDSKTWNLEIEE